MIDKMLTEAEAADLLGCKPSTLNNWRATKRVSLPYVKVGRLVRYPLSGVLAFIEARMKG